VKYTITDLNNDWVALEPDGDTVTLYMNDDSRYFVFSLSEFRDFRKAIGYVWQEVEDK
jgi:hypothetical protein